MDAPRRAKGSKKNRKHGQKKRKPTHLRYNNEGRHQKHREARIKKHLAKHPNDRQSKAAL